ncbi:MAG: amino acid racemase [Ferruginibacter sp.]|nr:amino acid racemase [Ferruginibacter sp.]
MKKIGLVGGISWTSTIDYYKYINEKVNTKLGGFNFAECIIYSLNFGDIQRQGWENSFDLLLAACTSLKKSGANCIVLCANTAHIFADQLKAKIDLPFIHIVEETAKEITKLKLKKVGLIGTKVTMENDFYKKKLNEYGLEVVIPQKQSTRDYIQQTLKEELGIGTINASTKTNYISIINEMITQGAECIVFGCTEIPMLLSQNDFNIPVFDTTKIHSDAIVAFALA